MRIAHLSDLHLARGPLAAQPAAALADALARLLAIEPRPDCVVITGDLADTGHPDEYAALRAILRKCPVPVHLLPGNHDDPAALIARFGDTPYLGHGVSPAYAVEYPEATLVIANAGCRAARRGASARTSSPGSTGPSARGRTCPPSSACTTRRCRSRSRSSTA